jgi:hypothetical protein
MQNSLFFNSLLLTNNNMFFNGGFDTSIGWDVGTGWTINGGVATYDDITFEALLIQLQGDMVSPILTNTNYTLEFDIGISSGTAWFQILSSDDNATFISPEYYANGHHSVNFSTTGVIGAGGLRIWAATPTSNPFTLDNLNLYAT